MFENKEKLPFNKLTKEQRSLIVEAWLSGKLQFLSKQGNWFRQDLDDGLWDTGTYRTRPVWLEIPWHLIDKKWNWAAMDPFNNVFFYSEEPTKTNIGWKQPGASLVCPNALAIPTIGVNWESSIQRRP